jgi:F-type H+-transporting ATPase subunit g
VCVAYRQPLLYNLAVAREFLKQIYTAERLAPPTSLSQITSVYQQLYSNAISIPFWRGLWTSGQWTKVAIYGLEAYGIFHIGEMIGRRHIIGYKLD